MAVTPERKIFPLVIAVARGRYKLITVSLQKKLRNFRLTSETTARRFQKRNGQLDPEVV
jgi:hypothetical protein